MTVQIKSHARQLKAKIRNENKRRLRQAAKLVKDEAKVLLGTSGRGRRVKGQVVPTASRRGKKVVYNAFTSRPGEAPRMQTGRLLKSVTQKLIGYSRSRVQTDAFYGRILDSPKYRYGQRPWLRRALEINLGAIRALLTRKMDLGL